MHHSFDPISKTLNTYIVIWEFSNIIHGMTMHTSNYCHYTIYRIAGKFGVEFNLAVWRILV